MDAAVYVKNLKTTAKAFNTSNNLDELSFISSKSAQNRFDSFVETCKELGFPSAIYTYKFPFPITKPYLLKFRSNKTPVTDECGKKNTGNMPVFRLLDCSTTVNIRLEYSGICYLYRDLYGATGSFSLYSEIKMEINEIVEKECLLIKICNEAHKYISDDIGIHHRYASDISLTDREREVLRWTADGKTCTDIADILSISRRTVEFHISNATEKLGTPSKCAAVVKALMLGVLTE